MVTDRHKLDGILTNLIKNAIKFTKQGSVEIGCYAEKEKLLLYVKDTGIGIPAHRINAIFERFVQADIHITRAHEGSGLGLSIVKAYTEALGGELNLESEPGKGSKFMVALPLRQADVSEKPKEQPEKQEVNQNNSKLILLAEDDDSSFEYLRIMLQSMGFSMMQCVDGEAAVKMAKEHPDIALILMDIKMPVMDGLEATKRIRKFNSEIPIIAQSAFALAGDAEKALAAGCNDYVTKPINRKTLTDIIKKWLH
jgi:CheY-like chemotaxis protein/anti-sigma regulatory factor (Ser/Thr protein kinase)